MCEPINCQKPEKLKGDPKECRPEQIAECHPDAEGHPCEEDKEQPAQNQ